MIIRDYKIRSGHSNTVGPILMTFSDVSLLLIHPVVNNINFYVLLDLCIGLQTCLYKRSYS